MASLGRREEEASRPGHAFSGRPPPQNTRKRAVSSKYDVHKVKVWLGDNRDHYYILSRFLICRSLTITKIPSTKAIKIALELKKRFVDNDQLNVSQAELEETLFALMRAKGYDKPYIDCYRTVSEFYQLRQPLVILLCGAPCTGKSTIAQQLAARLNMPNVMQTDVICELMRRGAAGALPTVPPWARNPPPSVEPTPATPGTLNGQPVNDRTDGSRDAGGNPIAAALADDGSGGSAGSGAATLDPDPAPQQEPEQQPALAESSAAAGASGRERGAEGKAPGDGLVGSSGQQPPARRPPPPPPSLESWLLSEFKSECRIVRRALEGDFAKSLNDGKPLIVEGVHLDPAQLLAELQELGIVILPTEPQPPTPASSQRSGSVRSPPPQIQGLERLRSGAFTAAAAALDEERSGGASPNGSRPCSPLAQPSFTPAAAHRSHGSRGDAYGDGDGDAGLGGGGDANDSDGTQGRRKVPAQLQAGTSRSYQKHVSWGRLRHPGDGKDEDDDEAGEARAVEGAAAEAASRGAREGSGSGGPGLDSDMGEDSTRGDAATRSGQKVVACPSGAGELKETDKEAALQGAQLKHVRTHGSATAVSVPERQQEPAVAQGRGGSTGERPSLAAGAVTGGSAAHVDGEGAERPAGAEQDVERPEGEGGEAPKPEDDIQDDQSPMRGRWGTSSHGGSSNRTSWCNMVDGDVSDVNNYGDADTDGAGGGSCGPSPVGPQAVKGAAGTRGAAAAGGPSGVGGGGGVGSGLDGVSPLMRRAKSHPVMRRSGAGDEDTDAKECLEGAAGEEVEEAGGGGAAGGQDGSGASADGGGGDGNGEGLPPQIRRHSHGGGNGAWGPGGGGTAAASGAGGAGALAAAGSRPVLSVGGVGVQHGSSAGGGGVTDTFARHFDRVRSHLSFQADGSVSGGGGGGGTGGGAAGGARLGSLQTSSSFCRNGSLSAMDLHVFRSSLAGILRMGSVAHGSRLSPSPRPTRDKLPGRSRAGSCGTTPSTGGASGRAHGSPPPLVHAVSVTSQDADVETAAGATTATPMSVALLPPAASLRPGGDSSACTTAAATNVRVLDEAGESIVCATPLAKPPLPRAAGDGGGVRTEEEAAEAEVNFLYMTPQPAAPAARTASGAATAAGIATASGAGPGGAGAGAGTGGGGPSGGALPPLFVPIVLRMREADHRLALEDNTVVHGGGGGGVSSAALPSAGAASTAGGATGPCDPALPASATGAGGGAGGAGASGGEGGSARAAGTDPWVEPELDEVLRRSQMIQQYLCSFEAQGVPIIDVRYGNFGEALDVLHEYVLMCIQVAMDQLNESRGSGEGEGEPGGGLEAPAGPEPSSSAPGVGAATCTVGVEVVALTVVGANVTSTESPVLV